MTLGKRLAERCGHVEKTTIVIGNGFGGERGVGWCRVDGDAFAVADLESKPTILMYASRHERTTVEGVNLLGAEDMLDGERAVDDGLLRWRERVAHIVRHDFEFP